jgi:drug/metabolite transporter (DMT)-like permease
MKSAWMLVAGLCFALMSAVVKVASEWFSGVELVFYRSLFAFVLIALPMLVWRRRAGFVNFAGHLAGEHLAKHLHRGLVGFLALVMFFYALGNLPMSMAVTLNYASPLFLALLMPWQLNERPTMWQLAAVGLGFCGMLLLLRPWEVPVADLWAGVIGLLSGVMAAFAYINVRKLGRLHEPEWRTVFWFAVVCLVGAGVLSTLQGWHGVNQDNVMWLLLLGALATAGQLAMTRAYRTGRTALVASFAFSAVLFSTLFDKLIFKESLPLQAWLGMLVIVAAGVWAAQLSFNDGQE